LEFNDLYEFKNKVIRFLTRGVIAGSTKVLERKNKVFKYILDLLKNTNKNATKSPSQQNPPKLLFNALSLVEFCVLCFSGKKDFSSSQI